ncbi:unnamed protein product [Amoebophrya sp. A120]|nr:unnamed protein product [Amoebophrya sp. A120]|eukprot:GSA120T00018323001.1
MQIGGYLRLAGALVLLLYPMSSRNALDFFDCMEHNDQESTTHRIFRHVACGQDQRDADGSQNAHSEYFFPAIAVALMALSAPILFLAVGSALLRWNLGSLASNERLLSAWRTAEVGSKNRPAESAAEMQKKKLQLVDHHKDNSSSFATETGTKNDVTAAQVSTTLLARIAQLEDFFGFAWAPFRSEFYWWCIVVLLKDCGFALSAILFRDGYSQVTCATSVLLVYLLSTHLFRPFASATANAQELLLTLLLVILGFAATGVGLDSEVMSTGMSSAAGGGEQTTTLTASSTASSTGTNNTPVAVAANSNQTANTQTPQQVLVDTSTSEIATKTSHTVLLFWQILGLILPVMCFLVLVDDHFTLRERARLYLFRRKRSRSAEEDQPSTRQHRVRQLLQEVNGFFSLTSSTPQQHGQRALQLQEMKNKNCEEINTKITKQQGVTSDSLLNKMRGPFASCEEDQAALESLNRFDAEELAQLERALLITRRVAKGSSGGYRRGAQNNDNLLLQARSSNERNQYDANSLRVLHGVAGQKGAAEQSRQSAQKRDLWFDLNSGTTNKQAPPQTNADGLDKMNEKVAHVLRKMSTATNKSDALSEQIRNMNGRCAGGPADEEDKLHTCATVVHEDKIGTLQQAGSTLQEEKSFKDEKLPREGGTNEVLQRQEEVAADAEGLKKSEGQSADEHQKEDGHSVNGEEETKK